MFKKALTLVVLAGLFGLFSCDKREQKDCPAFKEEFLVHLNYTLGDTLTYVNQSGNNELKFVVSQANKTEPYKCTTEGFGNIGDCPCINSVDFRILGVDNNMQMRTGMSAEGLDDGEDPISNPEAGYTVFSSDWPLEQQFTYTHRISYAPLLLKSQDTEIDEIEINGTLYQNVIQSIVDTLDKPSLSELEVWRMVIAQPQGIIQFEDRSNRQIWSLKN